MIGEIKKQMDDANRASELPNRAGPQAPESQQ